MNVRAVAVFMWMAAAGVVLLLNLPSSGGTVPAAPRGAVGAPPVKVKVTHPPARHADEVDETLKQWNAGYHAKRAALRTRREGPLSVHILYGSCCTTYGLYQMNALELSWQKVKQGGFMSRIIAGCPDAKEKQPLLAKSVVSEENQQYVGAFFTPSFEKAGASFDPYNRPQAFLYFLNHADLTEQTVVTLEPDMVFLQALPITPEFAPKGKPIGHFFPFIGNKENNYGAKYINCDNCTASAAAYESGTEIGIPYVEHIDDFRTIIPTWAALCKSLRKIDSGTWWLEFIAYVVASAKHGLQHTVHKHLMADHFDQEGVWEENTSNFAARSQPYLVHYCYREVGWIEIGEPHPKDGPDSIKQHERMIKKDAESGGPVLDYYHFSKYRLPTDWPGGARKSEISYVSCGTPLIQEFLTPMALPQNTDLHMKYQRQGKLAMLFIPALNDAMAVWKERNCETDKVNLQKRVRTSHPGSWLSKYDVLGPKGTDGKEVEFKKVGLD